MSRKSQTKLLILILIAIIPSFSQDILRYELNGVKWGTVENEGYNYYSFTLPSELDKDSHLIIEIEPNEYFDAYYGMISDPNLYVSLTENTPSINSNTWKSESIGHDAISINLSVLNPSQKIFVSIHCNENRSDRATA